MLTTFTHISHTVVDIVQMPSDPWRVDRIVASKTNVVTWKCKGNHTIYVMFPTAHSPLVGKQHELSAVEEVSGKISDTANGVYSYSILVQDPKGKFHSVEGNSPPEMVIE